MRLPPAGCAERPSIDVSVSLGVLSSAGPRTGCTLLTLGTIAAVIARTAIPPITRPRILRLRVRSTAWSATAPRSGLPAVWTADAEHEAGERELVGNGSDSENQAVTR